VTARNRWLAIAVPAAVVLLTLSVTGHRWATAHARELSGLASPSRDCRPCHVYTVTEGPLARVLQETYLSPLEITVASNGRRLYVTAEESDLLLVIDAERGQVVERIPVGRFPHSVVLSRDERHAYVSNRYANTVTDVDLAAARVARELAVGAGPAGMALDREGRFLYVANSISNDISIVDLQSGTESARLTAGQNPHAVALVPGGNEILVSNRISNPVPFRTPPVTEVTVVDAGGQRIAQRIQFQSAHLIEGVDFTPGGDLALVTLVRPKNLLPATQIERGWLLTYGVGVIERRARETNGDGGREAGHVRQLLLDDLESSYADPYDIVVTPDGRRAFVSHSGADAISVLDLDSLRAVLREAAGADAAEGQANHFGLSARYVVKRIATRENPKGLALAPDGTRLYVAERLADRIAVMSVGRLEVVGSIDLGGPERSTMVRRGERLFHSAGNTLRRQFSCRSCHPEGHTDALSYDLEPDGVGRNVVNNMTLRGLEGLAPYKWVGTNPSLYRQCGFRFAKWLTRTETYAEDDLYALVAYIRSLRHSPNAFRAATGALTPAQERGRMVFERAVTNGGRPIPPANRCSTCHPPPRFTNRQKFDVGTKGPTDSIGSFDTPALNNLYENAPFLHDGRAATLEEIWTRFGAEDRHGVVNDLNKRQLNDLIEYLKTLGGGASHDR